jgi:hypothetical protein
MSFDQVVAALQAEGSELSIAAMKLLVQMDQEREQNQDRLDKLDALERGGVDNWEWYDDCMEQLREDEDE